MAKPKSAGHPLPPVNANGPFGPPPDFDVEPGETPPDAVVAGLVGAVVPCVTTDDETGAVVGVVVVADSIVVLVVDVDVARTGTTTSCRREPPTPMRTVPPAPLEGTSGDQPRANHLKGAGRGGGVAAR